MTDQVLKGESSLADEIVQILRSRIINGEYAIGEKLVENKIAKELKVSRTPVREAFKQLTKENLIEYVPNKGCFAKGFEQNDLQDIYAVRIAVEQLAVAWAIKNKTDEDMARLKEQLEVMSLYTASGMVEKLIQADEEFNNVLYQMARSRFITPRHCGLTRSTSIWPGRGSSPDARICRRSWKNTKAFTTRWTPATKKLRRQQSNGI